MDQQTFQKVMMEKMEKFESYLHRMDVRLSVLEVKAGIYGAIAGSVVTAIGAYLFK